MFNRLTSFLGVVLGVILLSSTTFAKDPKIGFIYIGPPGDHGWTYMHDQGRQDIEIDLGFKTTYIENVPENADAVRAIRKLAASGLVLEAWCSGYESCSKVFESLGA